MTKKTIADTKTARRVYKDSILSSENGDLVVEVEMDLGDAPKSVAGRLQIAEMLLQSGILTTPEDYFKVISCLEDK